jgi:hypothetical protein
MESDLNGLINIFVTKGIKGFASGLEKSMIIFFKTEI